MPQLAIFLPSDIKIEKLTHVIFETSKHLDMCKLRYLFGYQYIYEVLF
jgi:hypothetical protein